VLIILSHNRIRLA